jgi:plastocyanin
MSSAPIVDRIRIIPRPADFLGRNVGSSGEVFFNKESSSLRVYSGKDRGGFEIARADLNNVTVTNDDISWIAYDELADLPSATDNHGMFAHVHGTGKAYYAHAGAWVELANQSDISGASDISDLTDTTNLLFDGAYSSLTGAPNVPSVLTDLGITDGTVDQVLTTDGAGNFTFADAASTQDVFEFVTSDDGSTGANAVNDTLGILGGTNIATTIASGTDNVEINMTAFSIDFLSDVDTTSSAPTTGQVLKWNGTNWAPGADVASGGSGLDADTLDGFDSAYYLNYNNFSNTPSVLTLASLSIGVELAASGDGAISYDNATGVFRYTPPDLSTYLTSVPAQTFASLTGKPTTLSGYGITDAQATLVSATNIKTINGTSLLGSGDISIAGGGSGIALTDLSVGTEGSASGNGAIAYNNSTGVFTYTPPVIPAAVTALTDLSITDGSNGQVLTTNGSGTFTFTTPATGVTAFSSLTDASAASIDIGKIYEPAIAMLRVDNVGTSAYTFSSHYSGNNPTIYAISGTTLAFDLDNISGHPFELQDNTLTALTSNLVHVTSTGTVSTNSNAQGKSSGTLYWRIPEGSPGTYVYQCQSHSSMFGSITVKDLSNI